MTVTGFPYEKVRSFSKVGDALPVPDLVRVQRQAYERFLQETQPPEMVIGSEGVSNTMLPRSTLAMTWTVVGTVPVVMVVQT